MKIKLELEALELNAVLKMRLSDIADEFKVGGRLLSLEDCARIRSKLVAYENILRRVGAARPAKSVREPEMVEVPAIDANEPKPYPVLTKRQ